MPIRINLLAEQLEAEEARRRDPIKRALWMGGAFFVTLLLFSASLQYRLSSGRNELATVQAKLQEIEADSKLVRGEIQKIGEIEGRMKGLQTYAGSRFYWATALDALQRSMIDNVRLISLASAQSYATNAQARFLTNVLFAKPVQSKWRFWSSAPQTNYSIALAQQLALITNRAEFVTNKLPATTKIVWTTNQTRVIAAVEIMRPMTATERVALTIEARDYSETPGQRVDEFTRMFAIQPYFKESLESGEGKGIRLKELAIRPEFDPQDPINHKPFIPFSIECRYQEKVRTNE